MLVKNLKDSAMFRHKDRTWHKWGNLLQSNQVLAWTVRHNRTTQLFENTWKIFNGNTVVIIPANVEPDEPDGLE